MHKAITRNANAVNITTLCFMKTTIKVALVRSFFRAEKLYNCKKNMRTRVFFFSRNGKSLFAYTLSLDIYLAQNTWRQLRWKTSYDDSRVQFLQFELKLHLNHSFLFSARYKLRLRRLSCDSTALKWTGKLITNRSNEF